MACCTCVNAAAKSSSEISTPSTRMRSLIRSRCGEVYRPVRKPAARRDRLEHGRGGAFAVGAGHVHGLELALRLPEVLAQHGDIFQIEFLRAGLLRRREFASQAEKVLHRFLVVHAAYATKKSSAEEM